MKASSRPVSAGFQEQALLLFHTVKALQAKKKRLKGKVHKKAHTTVGAAPHSRKPKPGVSSSTSKEERLVGGVLYLECSSICSCVLLVHIANAL